MMPNRSAPEHREDRGISSPAPEHMENREISNSRLSGNQVKLTEAKTGPLDSEQGSKRGSRFQILKQLETWNEWPESARKRLKVVLQNEFTSSPNEIVDQLNVSCVPKFLRER